MKIFETFECSAQILSNSLCQFLNNNSITPQILYPSSVSWKIIPLYFFSSNKIYFAQKEPIKMKIFETFECSAQILSNSLCQFLNNNSITPQILYPSSVSWKIIPLYFFSSNKIYFAQKEPIKMKIFETFECSAQILSNSLCQFLNNNSITPQILYPSSVSWKIIPLYFFSSNKIYFAQKEPIKMKIFETFECSAQILSNSLCQFLNNNSITPQILYPSSVSWKIIPLYFFSSNKIYFAQKEPIKMKIFETFECSAQILSNSLCQFLNDNSITPQILYPSSVSWKIIPLYFFSSNKIYFAQKEPIKMKIFETFECSAQILSNSLCQFLNDNSITLQILYPSSVSWKIIPLYFFSSNKIYFAQKEPIKMKIFETFECSAQILSNSLCQFLNDNSIPPQILYPSSISWKIIRLYFFSSNNIYFAHKEPIKVKIFEAFECSGQNLTNSLCKFLNDKLIPLQILYATSVSWKKTPLYFFSSNNIYFAQKEHIKMKIFETFKCSGQNSSNSLCQF